MIVERGFDVFLAVAVAVIAWRALTGSDTFTAIVLFIVYGVLMSLAWVRLGAVDVALAEAAIGAGLTGAILLEAVGFTRRRRHARPD
jgi:energy-converting hydrogenase B subunit D